jgi:hypothetical protein
MLYGDPRVLYLRDQPMHLYPPIDLLGGSLRVYSLVCIVFSIHIWKYILHGRGFHHLKGPSTICMQTLLHQIIYINMDLQEDMVIEGIYTYTPQNIYMGPCKCI